MSGLVCQLIALHTALSMQILDTIYSTHYTIRLLTVSLESHFISRLSTSSCDAFCWQHLTLLNTMFAQFLFVEIAALRVYFNIFSVS